MSTRSEMRPQVDNGKNQTNRTVLISVHNGFSARCLLRTDILRVLRDAGAAIVILTPNADEDYFREEFENDRVFVERLELEKCKRYYKDSFIRGSFLMMRHSALNAAGDLTTLNNKNKKYWSGLRRRSPVRATAMWTAVLLLRRYRWFRKAFIWLESKLFTGDFHKEVFTKYQPDLVVTSSPGYFLGDSLVMREAKKHGAKTVAAILSWDNPSSKGIGARVDHAVAWTELMKKELTTYLDFRESEVFVGGIAHWDIYHRDSERPTRDDFLSELGLDPGRKTIVLGTKSPRTNPRHDVLGLLADAVSNDRFDFPCQLVVRVHPLYFNGMEAALEEALDLTSRYQHVAFSIPEIKSNKLPFDMDPTDMARLDALLHHSDVLVNFHSTLTLEASICDLPVVNVGFEKPDGAKDPNYQPVATYRKNVHLRRVIETGGVPMAESPERLIQQINEYLADPSINGEGRALIAKQEGGPHPGHAGKEIGEFLLRTLGEPTGL